MKKLIGFILLILVFTSVKANPWPLETRDRGNVIGSPQVGDIDGDGDVEICLAAGYSLGLKHGLVFCWEEDGSLCNGFPFDTNTLIWFASSLTLGDVNNDGRSEIFWVPRETQLVFGLSGFGTLLTGWPVNLVWPSDSIRLADMVGDNELEILINADLNIGVERILHVYDWLGQSRATFSTPPLNKNCQSYPGAGSVILPAPNSKSDFACHFVCKHDNYDYNYALGIITLRGLNVSKWPVNYPSKIVMSSPYSADFTGEGIPDILHIWAFDPYKPVFFHIIDLDGNIISAKTFNAQHLAHFYSIGDFDYDDIPEVVFPSGGDIYVIKPITLDVLPGWPVTLPRRPNSGESVVADIDGDKSLDILLGNQEGLLYAFDSQGQFKLGFPKRPSNFTINAPPVITDLDRDGCLDILVAPSNGNVYRYELSNFTYDPYRCPWPQHTHDNWHTYSYFNPPLKLTLSIKSENTIQIYWQPSLVPYLGGYEIHYALWDDVKDNPAPDGRHDPYFGTGANEGDSPIIVALPNIPVPPEIMRVRQPDYSSIPAPPGRPVHTLADP